eukprot:1900492-Pleurochrysis_carterae.AAC.1
MRLDMAVLCFNRRPQVARDARAVTVHSVDAHAAATSCTFRPQAVATRARRLAEREKRAV